MSSRKVVLFTHIQKTAGTTLGRVLKAKYGFLPPSNFLRIDLAMGLHHFHYAGDFPAKRVAALEALSEDQSQKVRLVQGHMGFGIHNYFDQDYQYITVLRDPVRRVMSHYTQLQQQEWFPFKDEIRSMSFAEFMEKCPIDAMRNYQTKMLAGICRERPGDMTPYDNTPSDENVLKQAVENARDYYLCVITEKFDESLLLLQRKLGWRNAYYIRSNVTSAKKKRLKLNEESAELIRYYNALDLELYQYCLSQVDAEIAAMGESFQRDVATFRKKNQRVNQVLYTPIDGLFKVGRAILASRYRRPDETSRPSS